MAEKPDLDALERANLGKVVRPEDWMALLSYARRLERARAKEEVLAWIIDLPDEPELGHWFAEEAAGDGYRSRALVLAAATPAPEVEEVCGLKPGCCHKCGLPLSVNPHPQAGKPDHYLEVGCPKECIPCLVRGRHNWAGRAMKDAGDAGRYRWLEKQCENGLGLSYGADFEAVRTWFVRFPVIESGVGMSLGEAIDAAMKRSGEQKA